MVNVKILGRSNYAHIKKGMFDMINLRGPFTIPPGETAAYKSNRVIANYPVTLTIGFNERMKPTELYWQKRSADGYKSEIGPTALNIIRKLALVKRIFKLNLRHGNLWPFKREFFKGETPEVNA
jgi:hypothetical protein